MAALYWYRSVAVLISLCIEHPAWVHFSLAAQHLLMLDGLPLAATYLPYMLRLTLLRTSTYSACCGYRSCCPVYAMHAGFPCLVWSTYPACWLVLLLPVHAPALEQSSCRLPSTYCLSTNSCSVLSTSCWPSVPSILTTMPNAAYTCTKPGLVRPLNPHATAC